MSNIELLLVEDDLRLRDLLERYLSLQKFNVRGVANIAGMRKVLREHHVQLIVLDLMLPDGDGLSVCRQLRGEGNEVPIIMLTAKGDDVDRIVGLEIGADDYLTKPCNPRELVARIRAVLRRVPRLSALSHNSAVCFGDYAFEAASRKLTKAGHAIKLTSGECAVLAALTAHPGQTLTRDKLIGLTKGSGIEPFDRSIDVMIVRLRKLLEIDPKNPRWLQTVWGAGYVFAQDAEQDAAAQNTSPSASQSIRA